MTFFALMLDHSLRLQRRRKFFWYVHFRLKILFQMSWWVSILFHVLQTQCWKGTNYIWSLETCKYSRDLKSDHSKTKQKHLVFRSQKLECYLTKQRSPEQSSPKPAVVARWSKTPVFSNSSRESVPLRSQVWIPIKAEIMPAHKIICYGLYSAMDCDMGLPKWLPEKLEIMRP